MNYTVISNEINLQSSLNYLSHSSIEEQVNAMPDFSSETLRRFQACSPAQFIGFECSKSSLCGRVTNLRTAEEQLTRLKENRQKDRCLAISRAISSTILMSGAVVGIGIGGTTPGWLGFGVAFGVGGGLGIASALHGAINMHYGNQPAFIPKTEDGGEVCLGFCCGPCFACYEAVKQVPLRITLAEEKVRREEELLRQNFDKLITFCRQEKETQEVQHKFQDKVIGLSNEVAEYDEELQIFSKRTEVTANASEDTQPMLNAPQRSVLDCLNRERENLVKQQRGYQDSIRELAVLVQHIRPLV